LYHPVAFTLWVIAAAVIAIYMRKPRITFSPSVILGALCMAATTFLYIFANKLTTAANAIVLQQTAPIFVIILSAIFFKKRPRGLEILAVLLTFAGIALVFMDRMKASSASEMLGNVLACISGITFAGVFLINQMPKAKPEESLLLGNLIDIVICLPVIFTNITFEPTPWIAIVLMGVFQLGLSYVLFSIGIKITTPVSASIIAMLEPLLNPVWVFVMTGEAPGALALAGGAVVLVTLIAYNVISIRRSRSAESPGLSA
jgi:drug/metabolite transporter (DMT)-like permease